ncbi:MAG: uncharacterized protein QG608_34 [Actinomycetota bacterium]|nr:uncharacterized protein [Actinomycetota bacterium]
MSPIIPGLGPAPADPVWHNEPVQWRRSDGELALTAEPGSDFWRHTHFEFVRDSGHFLATRIEGEYVIRVEIEADLRCPRDCAGVMVRMDSVRWMTCGLEVLEPGREGVVSVMTHAVSDYCISPLTGPAERLLLRLTRRGDSLTVDYSLDDGPWNLHRLAYLPPFLPTEVGPMAISPDGPGFEARFRGWNVLPI